MPYRTRTLAGIGDRLDKPLADDALQGATLQLELDDNTLHRSMKTPGRVRRPFNEKVRALAAQAIFPADAATAIDDPLQERLHQQLRARLLVVKALQPGISLFAEELLEGTQQLRQSMWRDPMSRGNKSIQWTLRDALPFIPGCPHWRRGGGVPTMALLCPCPCP